MLCIHNNSISTIVYEIKTGILPLLWRKHVNSDYLLRLSCVSQQVPERTVRKGSARLMEMENVFSFRDSSQIQIVVFSTLWVLSNI